MGAYDGLDEFPKSYGRSLIRAAQERVSMAERSYARTKLNGGVPSAVGLGWGSVDQAQDYSEKVLQAVVHFSNQKRLPLLRLLLARDVVVHAADAKLAFCKFHAAARLACLRKSGPGDVLDLAPTKELRNGTEETNA
jgi:hypothetical protein